MSMVTRYDDCAMVMADTDRFSAARVVFEELTSRAPDLVLADQELRFPPIIPFRGPLELLVERPGPPR